MNETVFEPVLSIATWDIAPEELVYNAMDVIVKIGSVAEHEKIIAVVFVRLLFSGAINVTVPENANGMNNNRIMNSTHFFMV